MRTTLWIWICIGVLHGETIDSFEAKIELGHRLFYDADLSINGTMSCATCHEQKNAFTDGNIAHPGALGHEGKRNVPGLSNIGLFKNFTWANPYVSGLAQQALMPISGTKPIEMGMSGYEDEIAKRIRQNECYQKLFALAFGKGEESINLNNITQALESFQKTLISNNSLYDQKTKNHQPLPTKEAQEGEKLFFGAAKCNRCHTKPLFSDDDFHHVQLQKLPTDNKTEDNGLFEATGKAQDRGFFRTPSLRNAALTAPYWHDGSAKTLIEAIRQHNLTINQKLSKKEMQKIVAFIQTLNDNSFVTNPKFGKPSSDCTH